MQQTNNTMTKAKDTGSKTGADFRLRFQGLKSAQKQTCRKSWRRCCRCRVIYCKSSSSSSSSSYSFNKWLVNRKHHTT